MNNDDLDDDLSEGSIILTGQIKASITYNATTVCNIISTFGPSSLRSMGLQNKKDIESRGITYLPEMERSLNAAIYDMLRDGRLVEVGVDRMGHKLLGFPEKTPTRLERLNNELQHDIRRLKKVYDKINRVKNKIVREENRIQKNNNTTI